MDRDAMHQDMSLLLPATLRGRLYNMKLKLPDSWLPGQCCSSLPFDINQRTTCSNEKTTEITEKCIKQEDVCSHLQKVANTTGCIVVMVTEEGTDVIIPSGLMNGQQIFVARWEGQYIPLLEEASKHHPPGKTLLEDKTGWTKVLKLPKRCNRTAFSTKHRTAMSSQQAETEVWITDVPDNESQNDNLVRLCMDCCKNTETTAKRHSDPEFCNIPKCKNRKRKRWKDMPDNRKKTKLHVPVKNQRPTQHELQKKVVEEKGTDPQKRYQVFVCSDIAPPACLEVTPDVTVKCLKEDIFQTLGVAPEKQRLWTGRRFHLCEELSLEDHGIGPEANIHLDLTIGLLGGADREEGAGANPHRQSQVQRQQVGTSGGAHALPVADTLPATYDYQAVLYYENNHNSLSDIQKKIRPTLERWNVSVFDLERDTTTQSIVQDIGHTVNKCMHAVFCLPVSSLMEGFKFDTFLAHKLNGKELEEGRKILPIAFKPTDLVASNQTVRSIFRDEEVLKYYEADFWRRLYRGLSNKPGSPLSPSAVNHLVTTNPALQAVEPRTLASALFIPEEVVKDVLVPGLFGSQNRQKEEFISLWAGHCGMEGTRDTVLKALQQHSKESLPQDVTSTTSNRTPVKDSPRPGLPPLHSDITGHYHANITSHVSPEIHSTHNISGNEPKHTQGIHMHTQQAMAFFEARTSYLKRLVRNNRWLDVRGMEFDMIIRVPLEKLYVGLKVDKTHPYERAQLNRARAQLFKKHIRSTSFLPAALRKKVLDALNVEDLHVGNLSSESLLDELHDNLCPPNFSQDEIITVLQRLDQLFGQIDQSLVSRFQKAPSDKAITFGEAYQRFHNMVILGHPGSGKTTMSRWLTIKMAQSLTGDESNLTVGEKEIDPESDNKTAFSMGSARLPILVRIWEYIEYRKTCKLEREKSLLAYLMKNEAHDDKEAEVIKEYLDSGEALIIMDGLDEVPNLDDRDQVVQEVHRFLEDFGVESDSLSACTNQSSSDNDSIDSGNRLILTSRISGNYTSRLKFTLPRLTIEKMGTQALRQFFRAWMQGVKEGSREYKDATFDADEKAEQLLTALQRKRAALDMAKTPQLAGVIAAVHWNKGHLPSTRVELYEAAIENLTESWKARPFKDGLEEHEVRILLESAAEIMQSTNGTISTNDLARLTTRVICDLRGHVATSPLKRDSKSFLKIVQKDVGILVQYGENDYRMLHRSFQEYLAGCKFAESVDTLASAILRYIDDPTWREPIHMAIGYLSRKQPSDLHALLEKTIQLRGSYTDLLPSHVFCLIDSIDELEMSTIDNKRDIADVLINQLLAAMYSAAAPKRTPLSDKVWRVILQYVRKLDGYLPIDVRGILKSLLADPERVCGIAVIVDCLHWYDEQIIKLLIKMLPHDMLSWNLPVAFAVQKGISPDVKMPHLPLDAVAHALGSTGTDEGDSDEEFIQMLIKMLPPEYVLKLKAHKQRVQRSISEDAPGAESTPYSIVTSVIGLVREVNTERVLIKATDVYAKLDENLKLVLQVFEEKYRKFLKSLRNRVQRQGLWWQKQNRQDEQLVGKMKRPHWFLIFVALHGGYKNFHTPQSIKQYHEAASYLQLTYNQHLAFSQYVNPKWGEGDLTNQLEAFFASERNVVQDKWQNPPQFDTKTSYRHSGFIQGLFKEFQAKQPREISRQLVQRAVLTPSSQVTETADIAITLVALGVDVHSLFSEASPCDISSVLLRMAQMEESLKDPACRASEHIENDLFQVCQSLQNEDAKVLWSAVIATLTHAGAVPVDTSVISCRYSDNVKKYLIAEFLSYRFTSSCSDDYVQNALAATSVIDNAGLSPLLLMEVFLTISETHQHGKPIAAVPWPVESIWLRPTKDDIPITVLNNIQTLHPTISFLRTWALSKKNLGSILENSKDLLPEFLTVIWADQGDKSQDRAQCLRQYSEDLPQADKDALLQKAIAVESPYYKCRALIRLCSFFDYEKRAEILKMAADVCRQMDRSTQRAEVLERLCVEVNDNILKEEAFEAITNLANPEDKVRLLARLAFHFDSPRREVIMNLSLDATLMIENEEHRSETLAMLYPQCLHVEAIKDRAEEIASKLKNPLLCSFALGLHGKILHRHFEQLSSLSVRSRDIWTPVVLTALVRDAKKRLVTEMKESKVSGLLPSLDVDVLWTMLSQMTSAEEVLNELKERGSLIFSRTAALVLDSLMKGNIDDVCALFPVLSQAAQETFPLLYSWVFSPGVDRRVRQFAALLLAERRGINAGLVPHLVPLLESKEDLLRFRASVVIHHPCLNTESPTRFLSVLGPNVYKQLLTIAEGGTCGVGAALRISWMAYDIMFDDPNAIRTWFKEIEENPDDIVPWRAIERMKAVSDDVWETMLELLKKGVHPAAHEALLSGFCQQVHKKHFNEKRWDDFARLIPDLQKKELTHLRYFKGTLLDLAKKVQEIIDMSTNDNTPLNSLSTMLEERIAREHTVTFKDLLSNCDPSVVKEKFKFLVTHQMHANDSWVEDITKYFEDRKITVNFLQSLAVSLNGLLSFDVDDQEPYWRLRSNLLVITVAAARVIPVTFASLTHKDTGTPELHTLEENLVETVQQHRGWNGRRSALQLLGHMGSVTPLVVDAIIHGIQDVALVREAALEAIPSLKHLDHRDYLPKIVENLQHQSTLVSYTMAKILTSVATHSESDAKLRSEILNRLAEATRDVRSHRYVYFTYVPCKIPDMPRLDTVFYNAMLKISNITVQRQEPYSDPVADFALQCSEQESLNVANTLVKEGDQFVVTGLKDKAKESYNKALEIFTKYFSSDHSGIVLTKSKIKQLDHHIDNN